VGRRSPRALAFTEGEAMSLEDQLSGWTGPSSDTEKDKQDRTERMIRQAIDAHEPFNGYSLKVYAKGSYANNTNVRADSDVDIAVECTEALYWDESEQGVHTPGAPYKGIWTPAKLRSELLAAMKKKFFRSSRCHRVNCDTDKF
jgi:hypothetical protein